MNKASDSTRRVRALVDRSTEMQPQSVDTSSDLQGSALGVVASDGKGLRAKDADALPHGFRE